MYAFASYGLQNWSKLIIAKKTTFRKMDTLSQILDENF